MVCVELQEGENGVNAGGMMRIVGALEVKGKWSFQVRHVVGGDNSQANLTTIYVVNPI